MSLLALSGTNSVSGGYEIDNSCKFNSANSEAITTTNQASGNQKTWTWSGWIKRTNDSTSTAEHLFGAGGAYLRFVEGETLNVQQNGSSLTTNQVFRDTAAWFHLVWILDTTQSTEADRSRIYINGSRITSFSSASYPSQNADLDVGGQGTSSNWLQLGRWYAGGRAFNGYMAEIHYLNGTVAEPSNFGETDSDSGIWIPKQYTGGGYGTQGYYYKFDDSSNMGKDSSGEGHDANSVENITAADQATDTPTNNFCTFNAIQNYDGKHTYTNGATVFGLNTDSGSGNTALGTIAVTKGKWYAEFKPTGTTSTSYPHNVFLGAGVMDQVQLLSTGFLGGKSNSTAQGMGYYNNSGNVYRNGGNFAWGNTYTANDIIGVALDYRSDGTAHLYFAKNGTWQNSSDPANNTSPITMNYGSAFSANTFIALGASIFVDDGVTIECNFGGYTPSTISSAATDENGYGTFEYAPPSGYYALCSRNLSEYG